MQVTITKSKLNRLCETALFNHHLGEGEIKLLNTVHRLTLDEDIITISLSSEEYCVLKRLQ